MLELVDPKDRRAVRNKDNVLALYELMINQKKSEEATAKFLRPDYVQHNPLIADGAVALGQYFGQATREHARARVVVHKIIAVSDYVFAHVNFLNLLSDDPRTPASPVSISTGSMQTERLPSIGTRCNSLATR